MDKLMDNLGNFNASCYVCGENFDIDQLQECLECSELVCENCTSEDEKCIICHQISNNEDDTEDLDDI